MISTFHTRIPFADGTAVLDAFGELYGRVQRDLHAAMMSGRSWTGDLQTSFYRPYGLTSAHLSQIYRQLLSKHAAAVKQAKRHVDICLAKAITKGKQIERKKVALDKARRRRPSLTEKHDVAVVRLILAKPDQWLNADAALGRIEKSLAKSEEIIATYPAMIHQHKREAASLRHEARRAEGRANQRSLCFGSKERFRKQFNLKSNGFADHAAWLRNWREARSGNIFFSGDSAAKCGNAFVRPRLAIDGSFTVRIYLPEALRRFADPSLYDVTSDRPALKKNLHAIEIASVRFTHGRNELIAALSADDKPISWRFVRDDMSWRIFVTFDDDIEVIHFDSRKGVLGVDLRVGFASVTHVDRHGNFVRTFRFAIPAYGQSSAQAKDAINKAARKIAFLGRTLGIPVAAEALNFEAKKAELKSPRYARMLSSFAYSKFGLALERACTRAQVGYKAVNPAFTSIIGRLKFARPVGLSVYSAAAMIIARRAMRLSERPSSLELTFEDGDHVALDPPARMDRRHVWSSWRKIASNLKMALAARALSDRAKRKSGRQAFLARGKPPSGQKRTIGAPEGENPPHCDHGMAVCGTGSGRAVWT